jgi:hypothetical protein
MLTVIIPLVVCILGLLMWALAQNALVKEAGRIMFAFGLLVTLLLVGASKIHFP